MATLNNANTLGVVELARRFVGNKFAVVAEVLAETNEIIQDSIWMAANMGMKHKGTQRTNLPTGTWRQINSGVPVESSQTIAVEEGIGFLEAYSQVDATLYDLAPDKAAFRSSEDAAFLEGLGQTWADTLLAGDATVTPETFTGLQPRLNTLSNPNVINQGGSNDGSMTSIYVVQWGLNKVHMIHPQNSRGALEMQDKGVQTVTDANGNKYEARVTHFKFYGGLFVHDTRCIKRICNIDLTDITGLDDKIIEALNSLPFSGKGAMIYCNNATKTALEIAAKDKSNVQYGVSNLWGEPVTSFRGVPVRRWDSITTTENVVS